MRGPFSGSLEDTPKTSWHVQKGKGGIQHAQSAFFKETRENNRAICISFRTICVPHLLRAGGGGWG